MKIPQYIMDGLGGEYLLTQELEGKIAAYLGVKHCIFVTSGTVAISLSLKALGAKKVAIPALTMFGSATAAEMVGCDITFVSGTDLPSDIDTYLHVSLNGRGCGIDEVVQKHPNVTIVEDACQSFGSKYKGKFLGTFGKVGCFSFSPHKILSAGNGGCIVTDDDLVARDIRRLKNFGREVGGADIHEHIGYNFKFTDLQAKFVLEQFASIDERIQKKKRTYARLYEKLSAVMRPHDDTPWFNDIYPEDREGMIAHLAERGIGTRKMYPLLISQKPFENYTIYGNPTDDTRYAANGLWLPSSLTLTDEEINYIIAAVQERI